VVVIRDGKNLTGRLLGSVKAIEARNNKAERLDAGNSSIAA
jgi:hypothetical protein